MTSPPARPEERSRRRRSDHGSFRASERDLDLLYLVGEQYATTLPQLARLIERSEHTARALRDRWKRAGWVGSGKLAVAAPSFVWLAAASPSPSPRTVPGSPTTASRSTSKLSPRSGFCSNTSSASAAGSANEKSPTGLAQLGERRSHLPDAVLSAADGRIAIEVELTLKNRNRLAEIANESSDAYELVWYFARPTIVPALRKVVAESAWNNIEVYPYPPSRIDLAQLRA